MIKLKNFNILFAEDDLEIQSNMGKILEMLFNKVFIVNDGLEALKIFEENLIHIILTDYEMPNMNGYELSKRIREKNLKLPIIILSNHTDKDKLLKCIPLNLTSYLEKPIIYETLLKVLMICEKQIDYSSTFKYKLDEKTIYNFKTKEIMKEEIYTKLTLLESILFEYLLDKKNQIVSKEELLTILNKDNYYDEISLKNIIYRLKKKFNNNSLIVNQKNMGYMLKIQ